MTTQTARRGYEWKGNNYCAGCLGYAVAESLSIEDWYVELDGFEDLTAYRALNLIARKVGMRVRDLYRPLDYPPHEEAFCSSCLDFFTPPKGT